MRIIVLVSVFSVLSALALSGCSNTFDGAGRDIEKAGESIQRTF